MLVLLTKSVYEYCIIYEGQNSQKFTLNLFIKTQMQKKSRHGTRYTISCPQKSFPREKDCFSNVN